MGISFDQLFFGEDRVCSSNEQRKNKIDGGFDCCEGFDSFLICN